MKSKLFKLSCILLSASLLTAFAACGGNDGDDDVNDGVNDDVIDEGNELYSYRSYAYFNAALAQWVFTKQTDETDSATWGQITSTLKSVEQSVSVSEEESAISKFNAAEAGAQVELDQTAYNLFVLAKELYEKTEGAYNPAVGNLIDLWGFSPRFSGNYKPQYPYDRANPRTELPDEKYVTAFLSLSDFSEVLLSEEDGKYYAQKPVSAAVELEGVTYTMQLNFGGIGKGYAVDCASEYIRTAGYEYGYFNLGGSSMSVLKNPTKTAVQEIWEIGIVNPRFEINNGGNFMAVLEKDICLSSSGDYNQFYTLGGKRYSHLINPFTGYPVNAAPNDGTGGIICASVFGLSAAEGDATTTALIAMGKEKAVDYIQTNLSDVHVLFVYDNGDGSYTLYTNMDKGSYRLYAQMETVKL